MHASSALYLLLLKAQRAKSVTAKEYLDYLHFNRNTFDMIQRHTSNLTDPILVGTGIEHLVYRVSDDSVIKIRKTPSFIKQDVDLMRKVQLHKNLFQIEYKISNFEEKLPFPNIYPLSSTVSFELGFFVLPKNLATEKFIIQEYCKTFDKKEHYFDIVETLIWMFYVLCEEADSIPWKEEFIDEPNTKLDDFIKNNSALSAEYTDKYLQYQDWINQLVIEANMSKYGASLSGVKNYFGLSDLWQHELAAAVTDLYIISDCDDLHIGNFGISNRDNKIKIFDW